MRCPYCGAQIGEEDRFCFRCGAEIPQKTKAAQPPPAGPPPLPPQVPPTPSYWAQIQPVEYAGFWKRFAAWIIDAIILFPLSFVITLLINWVWWFWGISWIINMIVGWLYYSLFESSSHQATLGKMALGIIVTDLNGDRISFARATGRHFSKILSALILFIGFIMIGFTEKKQGLHDMIAGTLVVNK